MTALRSSFMPSKSLRNGKVRPRILAAKAAPITAVKYVYMGLIPASRGVLRGWQGCTVLDLGKPLTNKSTFEYFWVAEESVRFYPIFMMRASFSESV